METSEIENLTKNIVDAVTHLNDSRLATPVDVIIRGTLSHEVLDCWDSVLQTNDGIDEAINSIDSIVDSIDD
jgi:hypothetical protein